jgi:DNA-binding SARP family transcriptional activator
VRGRPGLTPHLAHGLAQSPSRRYGRATNGLDFSLLGPLQVAANGTVLPLGGAKQRAVLALLLLNANEVVPIDRLIDELWGERPPESAANMIQGYVSHLRKMLEPGRRRGEHDLIVSEPPGYVLRIGKDQLDAERFVQLTAEARRLLAEDDPAAAAERLRTALGIWRGPVLADLAYEPFVAAEVRRLEELRLGALEDRIDADLALGRQDPLIGELGELVIEHPLRERLRGQLMTALYRSGRQADALAVYRETRTTLRDELGIEPGPALRDLEQAILRQDPELGAPTALPLPIATRLRRRWRLSGAVAVLAGALAIGLTLGLSGGAKAVVVEPNSVAVIDPAANKLVKDIGVGGYPGPLAADDMYVYVCNIGDATISRIRADEKRYSDTSGFSRATDMVVFNGDVWAANGGAPGHTPTAPPGTIMDFDFTAAKLIVPVGPAEDGPEEETTIAPDPAGIGIWAGNQGSETVRLIDAVSGESVTTVHAVAPGGLATTGDAGGGTTVWASDPKRNIVVRIDAGRKRVTRRVPIAGGPTRVAADERGVWVISRGFGDGAGWSATRGTKPAVFRIDPRTNTVVARIPLPLTPVRIALGAGSVWVTAEHVLSARGATVHATVFRIDPASNRIVARIPLGTSAVDGVIVSHGLVWAAVPPSQ